MLQQDKLNLLLLRVCVGYLGESHQNNWWTSSFYSSNSTAFLTPVFGKTSYMTQYYGVRDAAAIVHDELIGIGEGISHLFRLPEKIEREFHNLLKKAETVELLSKYTNNKEVAMEYLGNLCGISKHNAIGPVRIGNSDDIEKTLTWSKAAEYYLKAFNDGSRIFPYVKEGL
jgi:hypothetical protein